MFVRVQSTNKVGKAKKLRKDLERSGLQRSAVTIALVGDQRYHVISEMRLEDIALALFAAAKGIENAKNKSDAEAREIKLDHESHDPIDPKDRLGRLRHPEIKEKPDGSLEAPPGETFIFCGECGAARWYMTQKEFSLGFERSVCVSCGNELRFTTTTASMTGRA